MPVDDPAELTIWSARPDHRTTGNVLAILSFVLAGGILLGLERWAWRDSIEPHLGLVKRTAVPAVVLSHQVEEQGTGPQGSTFPQVTYRYFVSGTAYESSTIRSGEYLNEDGEIGVCRFDGPDRHQLVQSLFDQFSVGSTVTAWVDLHNPNAAMLVPQQPSFQPFLWALMPALFVPILWVMVVGVLRIFFQRPRARWLAMGWSILTLASSIPMVWQYGQLMGENQAVALRRLLDVGLGIATLSLVGSLLPGAIRSGLAIGSIVSFSVFGGLGTALAAGLARWPGRVGGSADPARVFVGCMECALVGGIVLGLLIAIGASRGVIWIRTDDEDCGDKCYRHG